MAVRTGLEPATSCVTGRHSNQLNYRTIWLRGQDLNLRPSGYEPDELPLLHPAIIKFYIYLKKMAEAVGFEPTRGLTRLSVFKTDPFSQTWVFLHDNYLNGGPCRTRTYDRTVMSRLL